MYFITSFPMVKGRGSMMVVVHSVLKYAIFPVAPTHCPAEEAAALFLSRVVKHFDLPVDIISDRDMRFTEGFWTSLFWKIGSKL